MSLTAYDEWINDPTPENMGRIMDELKPTINSEVYRYQGPKPILRGKARNLAIKSIKSYDPTRGTNLRTWVVNGLKPLARYGQQMRPVQTGEVLIRQAAELNNVTQRLTDELNRTPTDIELADKIGISTKRINQLRKAVKPTVYESTFDDIASDDDSRSLPGTIEHDYFGDAEDIVYNSLDKRDKSIYDMKTGRNKKPMLSNKDIAKRLGVSPAFVTQRSAAIAKMISDTTRRRQV